MNQPEFPYVTLAKVKENSYYLFDGQLMTGSALMTFLQANEPANPDEIKIVPMMELDKELLTGEQSQ